MSTLPCDPALTTQLFVAPLEQLELDGIASAIAATAIAFRLGQPCLRLAAINWRKHQGPARQPLGTPAPAAARDSYTRAARREQLRRRQGERRGEFLEMIKARAR